jgi:nucleoside-diphosphate-sugar epimerase
MKVLVTGSQGYIGAILVPMLLKKGFEVYGLDTDYYERCTFYEDMVDVALIRKDVRNVEKQDFQGIHAVIHLAGLSNEPLGDYNPRLTDEINEKV